MKRILLIKLTSLGDLIHALPALNDAYHADRTFEFDWVVDASFSEVASWHPAIKRIFCTSHRTWRKNLANLKTYKDIRKLIHDIRETKYDLVIDGQGNFKTALMGLFARGTKAGYDRHSVREWIAHIGYQKKISASKKAHAITRLRILFSQSIGYPLPKTPPNFRLKENCFIQPPIQLPSSYLFFVHNASWQTKLWPEQHWIELIVKSVNQGFQILLPWGNSEEEARAKRLAILPGVTVLPRLSLSQIGYVLKNALAAVCMDTGLSHLAAALNIPAITLYGATDSGLTGSRGQNQCHLHSTLPCSPCNQKTCKFKIATAPCLSQITPEKVFQNLIHMTSKLSFQNKKSEM
jgi:heptosyltransferase-1